MAESSPKRVENAVKKGEIARYEQFLLFPQCFPKACFPGSSKSVIVWEWVNVKVTNSVSKKYPALLRCFIYIWKRKIVGLIQSEIVLLWNLDDIWDVEWNSPLKVALQIFGRKFYKSTKKSSLYFQCLLIFIHKTPVVDNDPTTREIRELLRPRSTPMGITVDVLHEQLADLHAGNTQKKVSNIFFFQKSKNNLRDYVAF